MLPMRRCRSYTAGGMRGTLGTLPPRRQATVSAGCGTGPHPTPTVITGCVWDRSGYTVIWWVGVQCVRCTAQDSPQTECSDPRYQQFEVEKP